MSAPPVKRLRLPSAAGLSLAPAWIIAIAVYVGTVLWTIGISLTQSKLMPMAKFAGLDQYQRLFATERWQQASENLLVFGVAFIGISMVTGFLLAVALDQKIRGEGVIRTIYLYPFALSFIVTGVVWKWLLDPTMGLQKAINGLGWTGFQLDWVVNPDMAIYALVIAAVWQASGLVMALMLAGLRGIDTDLWNAIKVDGIPAWRAYLSIILPIMKPVIVTSMVLLGIGVVKAYDLVVALTGGGPGFVTDMPAKFIMDFLFQRSNIALASAGSTVVLVIASVAVVPWLYFTYFRTPKSH